MRLDRYLPIETDVRRLTAGTASASDGPWPLLAVAVVAAVCGAVLVRLIRRRLPHPPARTGRATGKA